MPFLDAVFGKGPARSGESRPGEAPGAEAILYLSASDAGWAAALTEGASIRWQQRHWAAVAQPEASAANRCAEAARRASAEAPQARIARIVLSVDDPDLQLMDHRFAKLANFEPRALKEFGAQQAGGRPVVFSSLPFGASSARELQRRALAFLPEDRLQSLFFALGRMATALVAVVPGAAASQFAGPAEGISAELRVHGYFSTLTIANAENGLIAARRIPFGALALAQTYASAHGIAHEEAVEALRVRSRLPAAGTLHGEPAPEQRTATFAALAPPLRELVESVKASLDYFRYERLAGLPAHLGLVFGGPEIAGFEAWLASALEMRVERLEFAPPAPAGGAPLLNLLEHCRPGLLKLGSEPFEFSSGRFVPMKGTQAEISAKEKSHWSARLPALGRLAANGRVANVSLKREPLMAGLLAVALPAFFAIGNLMLFAGPAEDRLAAAASGYTDAAARAVALALTANGNGPEAGSAQSSLWAEDIFSIGSALVPGMRLRTLHFAQNGGQTGAESGATLTILGALPEGNAANLKLVSGFIGRLSKDASFTRRFPRVRFAGASEVRDGARPEMTFGVAATVGAGR